MELERTLLLEPSPTRRWIAILAIVTPVAAVVMVAAWFVRVYVAPPSITITAPAVIAVSPPPRPAPLPHPAAAADPAPKPVMALAQDDGPANAANGATVAHSLEPASPTTVGSIPPAMRPVEQVFATLAAAPPDFNKLGDHTPDATAVAPNETRAEIAPAGAAPGSAATITDAEPIKAPIPLPRRRPHIAVASISRAVPLPRPRPAAEQAAPAAPVEPAIRDQHGVH